MKRGDLTRGRRLLVHVGNELGWLCHSAKQRDAMVVQVVQRMDDSALFTWDNLYLTVAYLKKQRQPVKSPMFLFYRVEDALAAVYVEPVNVVEDLLSAAVTHERLMCHEGWQDWVAQLHRASGPGRQQVYDLWLAAGRAS